MLQIRSPNWSTLAGSLLLVVAALAVEAWRWAEAASPAETPALSATPADGSAVLSELSRSLIPMPEGVPSAHASTLATLPGGDMVAFWWAGSRESGPDVKVYAARWSNGTWSSAWEVASRESLGNALGYAVRRIGNPAAWTDRDGRIHLYIVATGLGGWAASRVVHTVSSDLGKSFEARRVLPMSPLFNTSVLVRTSPVGLAQGGWWLPVHFEIGNKYSMLMAFDANGEPSRLGLIGSNGATLQPAIVPVSETEVRAWMRDPGDEGRIQQARSHDGGASWEDLPASDLPNDDTSLAALRLVNGDVLMLYNDRVQGGSARSTLRLAIQKPGQEWQTLRDVASGQAGDEFSYPAMMVKGDELHVTYTHQRQSIAHHRYRISFGENI